MLRAADLEEGGQLAKAQVDKHVGTRGSCWFGRAVAGCAVCHATKQKSPVDALLPLPLHITVASSASFLASYW